MKAALFPLFLIGSIFTLNTNAFADPDDLTLVFSANGIITESTNERVAPINGSCRFDIRYTDIDVDSGRNYQLTLYSIDGPYDTATGNGGAITTHRDNAPNLTEFQDEAKSSRMMWPGDGRSGSEFLSWTRTIKYWKDSTGRKMASFSYREGRAGVNIFHKLAFTCLLDQ